jgi:hypothetical protein
LISGPLSGLLWMNAPDADTQTSRLTPATVIPATMFSPARAISAGLLAPRGPSADSTASAPVTSLATLAASVASPVITVRPAAAASDCGLRASAVT